MTASPHMLSTLHTHTHAMTQPGFGGLPAVILLPIVLLGCITLSYLIGSIPFGLLLGKWFKVGDLRESGSGNIGATNMLRVGGRNLAIATLALDMAKGYVAYEVCAHLSSHFLNGKMPEDSIKLDVSAFYYLFGLYAVIGHVWPVWLKGKGGKGVATSLGVLFGFSPVVGTLTIACWLATFAATLYSSAAALVSITVSCVLSAYFLGKSAAFASTFIALIVIFRHKDNISRLMQGTEPKVELKK